jgi:PKHD-type hydroxylase
MSESPQISDEPNLPPYLPYAVGKGFLDDAAIDALIAEFAPGLTQGTLLTGGTDAKMRRSQIVFIKNRVSTRWLYRRVFALAEELNRRFFCAEISRIEGNIQLARYDSSDQGFYGWHTDFSRNAPRRKISVSIQLSRPEDYDGGELELFYSGEPYACDKERGDFIAFPSFMLHRVRPVSRGTRWSLVAWISGPRWR